MSGYCPPCNALRHKGFDAVIRIASALVGSRAAYRRLNKEARAAVRDHATELYIIGGDFGSSSQRLSQSPDGFVYIITNPAWTAIKIGMAVEPHGRLKQYQTSSPNRDYKLVDYVYVSDRRKAEAEIHDWLGPRRLDGEWFDVPVGEARMVLNLIKGFYRPDTHQSEATDNE